MPWPSPDRRPTSAPACAGTTGCWTTRSSTSRASGGRPSACWRPRWPWSMPARYARPREREPVFTALRSDELLVGVGRVLRQVAGTSNALEDYERSQALSAYSVTRLLAAEERAAAELLARTKEALHAAL